MYDEWTRKCVMQNCSSLMTLFRKMREKSVFPGLYALGFTKSMPQSENLS